MRDPLLGLRTIAEQGIHLRCRFPLELGKDVAVAVHGEADIGMPELLHDQARMNALDQEEVFWVVREAGWAGQTISDPYADPYPDDTQWYRMDRMDRQTVDF